MCLRRKKRGKSKVLSGGLSVHDSEAEQRTLQLLQRALHIYCSIAHSYSSAPESNKLNPGLALVSPVFISTKTVT